MTEKKTLSLGPREWNALLASNAEDMAGFFKSQPNPTPEFYANIVNHIERMRAILPGWLASAAQQVSAPAEQPQIPPVQANGAAPPKRKRGRPPGKTNKVRNAPGIAQVQ